jgi:hypothetical protein
MPRFVAASTSTLLYPTPNPDTTRRCGAASKKAASMGTWFAQSTPSAPAMAASNSLPLTISIEQASRNRVSTSGESGRAMHARGSALVPTAPKIRGCLPSPQPGTSRLVRVFHFSDEPDIAVFVPRTPAHRPEVEPVVWAVDEQHAATYLFPRDCPRVLLWLTPQTTPEDRERWWGNRTETPLIAHVEWEWYERLRTHVLFRYELPPASFTCLENDPWMWVSRETVEPLAVTAIRDIPAAMAEAGVELRLMRSLAPLWNAWGSTVHFSGIRLRNSRTWPADAPAPEEKLDDARPRASLISRRSEG